MVDAGVVIDMLFPASDDQPVEVALDAFTAKQRHHIISNHAAGKTERVGGEGAVVNLPDAQVRDVKRGVSLANQPVMKDPGPLFNLEFRDRIGKVDEIIGAAVVLDQAKTGAFFHVNDVARMGHGWLIPATGEVEQVDGTMELGPVSDPDIGTAGEEGGVQLSEDFEVEAEFPAEKGLQLFRSFEESIGKAMDLDTRRRSRQA
jgi:hypothetical protein